MIARYVKDYRAFTLFNIGVNKEIKKPHIG